MENFINQLLADKGVPSNLDAEVRQELVNDLTSRLTDMINRRVIDSMSAETAENFNRLIDEQPDNGPVLEQFIGEHVPERERIVAEAMYEFRALYLGASA